MQLAVVQQAVQAGVTWSSVAPDGLNLGVLLTGVVDVQLAGDAPRTYDRTRGYLLTDTSDAPIEHQARDTGILHCAFLHIPRASLDALLAHDLLGTDLEGQLARLARQPWLDWDATAAAAIGRAAAACPLTGIARHFYLHAKAYEFLALALAALDNAGPARATAGLTAADVERLHAARAMLQAEYAAPPDLATLARRTGLSVTRLTAGFRRLFGDSVIGFVQQHRLQVAHDGLASGGMTVKQAAWAAGYEPSAFSRLFHRRYGTPPSALRQRHH